MDGGASANAAETVKLIDELAAVCRARGIAQLRVGDVQLVMGPAPIARLHAPEMPDALDAEGRTAAEARVAKRERLRKLLGRVPTEGELEALP